ncbi:uncharacterized protein LOC144168317 [Haemaphysalis longicornis]
MADILQLLSSMLSSKQESVWEAAQENAFAKWKTLLSSSSVITVYSNYRATKIAANAPSYGLGAVVRQNGKSKEEEPSRCRRVRRGRFVALASQEARSRRAMHRRQSSGLVGRPPTVREAPAASEQPLALLAAPPPPLPEVDESLDLHPSRYEVFRWRLNEFLNQGHMMLLVLRSHVHDYNQHYAAEFEHAVLYYSMIKIELDDYFDTVVHYSMKGLSQRDIKWWPDTLFKRVAIVIFSVLDKVEVQTLDYYVNKDNLKQLFRHLQWENFLFNWKIAMDPSPSPSTTFP